MKFRKPLSPAGQSRATTNMQLERDVIEQARNSALTPKAARAAFSPRAKRTSPRSEPRRTASDPSRSTRLAIVKGRLGNMLLSIITRETIEGFQAKRKLDGVRNRTVNMDVGVLRTVLKRYGHWRRLQDHVTMLSEVILDSVFGRAFSLDPAGRPSGALVLMGSLEQALDG